MRCLLKQLLHRSVQTTNGIVLGRFIDAEVETETGALLHFYVKPQGLVRSLVARELCIAWMDVVEVRADAIIVRHLAVSSAEEAKEAHSMSTPALLADERTD